MHTIICYKTGVIGVFMQRRLCVLRAGDSKSGHLKPLYSQTLRREFNERGKRREINISSRSFAAVARLAHFMVGAFSVYV